MKCRFIPSTMPIREYIAPLFYSGIYIDGVVARDRREVDWNRSIQCLLKKSKPSFTMGRGEDLTYFIGNEYRSYSNFNIIVGDHIGTITLPKEGILCYPGNFYIDFHQNLSRKFMYLSYVLRYKFDIFYSDTYCYGTGTNDLSEKIKNKFEEYVLTTI